MADILLVRRLEIDDYNRGFLECLSVLTVVGEVSFDLFKQQFERRNGIVTTMVCVDTERDIVCGTASLVLEPKFIHGCGAVGHIEDVAVQPEYAGRGVGRQLIEALKVLGTEFKCYKLILDCHPRVAEFYEKCGLHRTDQSQMRIDVCKQDCHGPEA